ncbi:MAG: hypothetical protein HY455_01680 [Parcubacteria group bacterium]|nr:hypothetical protein [Parcubacteria group bacterium]
MQQPGYSGKRRDEIRQGWDKEYGPLNWRIAWQVNDIVTDFLGVCALYEDAYFKFLCRHQDVLATLVNQASEVYDDAPSNVLSGFNYLAQETNRTHIQDIAIRKCLVRMALQFRGKELIRIRDSRGTHPLSKTLSPGRIPFHVRRLIVTPELSGWWEKGSVESFYQSNKVLQVRKGSSPAA